MHPPQHGISLHLTTTATLDVLNQQPDVATFRNEGPRPQRPWKTQRLTVFARALECSPLFEAVLFGVGFKSKIRRQPRVPCWGGLQGKPIPMRPSPSVCFSPLKHIANVQYICKMPTGETQAYSFHHMEEPCSIAASPPLPKPLLQKRSRKNLTGSRAGNSKEGCLF